MSWKTREIVILKEKGKEQYLEREIIFFFL